MLAIAFATAAFQLAPVQIGDATHSATKPKPLCTDAVGKGAPVNCGMQELGLGAPGTTYIVDSHGGGDFLDLPPAIAASQAGDVLLVMPGNYSKFTLSKGLTVIGSGLAKVTGPMTIAGVPSEELAAVVGLECDHPWRIDACAGPILVQDAYGARDIRVDQCADVRFRALKMLATFASGLDGVLARGSRIELVDSFAGGNSLDVPGTAGAGIAAESNSRIHAVNTRVAGAFGGMVNNPNWWAPDGGCGVFVEAGSEVIAIGPTTWVSGGSGGWNMYYEECDQDGAGAVGVNGQGVFAYSQVDVTGGWSSAFQCTLGGSMPPFGSQVAAVAVSPRDPELVAFGAPNAGSTLLVEVVGEPGASVVLWLGRKLVRTPTPGVVIEQLVSHDFAVPLGTLDANGKAAKFLTLDAGLTAGLVFGMQAEVTAASVLQRTNSVPVVVR
ncbi:MAG: hypothetical protein HZA52_10570 [Planctomycetes bacterium]|nr:hypothetical protein [Planctomycetota bacterium]